ncbi:hypothetical protein Anas_14673 [Armadillidium nasatum]|uniref:Uncharacterized protein n=1 Tax=Armadillidium nasatum TaxID=96803 RepID=A0A5N5SM10_9CRUS|nr:hypothetical protein Anas_14673 [Armadillidium nasatum]
MARELRKQNKVLSLSSETERARIAIINKINAPEYLAIYNDENKVLMLLKKILVSEGYSMITIKHQMFMLNLYKLTV